MNRISWATKCGKLEHHMGRWLFVPIAIQLGWQYYRKDLVGLLIGTGTFVTWVVYLFSHTFEKLLYGKGLRR